MNNSHRGALQLALVAFLTFTSCGIYRQNVVNAPMLQHKGELQVSGHASFSGWEGQAACAVTDKIAVLANYSDLGTRKENYSAYNYSTWQHDFKEIGAGLYKKKVSGKTLELFAFAGYGSTSHEVGVGVPPNIITGISMRKARYSRFAIQGDLGNAERRFSYCVSPRLVNVNYYNIFDTSESKPGYTSATHIYAEGAFTMRYKVFPCLAIVWQQIITIPVVKTGAYLDFSPFAVSAGIMLDLNLLKQPRPQNSEPQTKD